MEDILVPIGVVGMLFIGLPWLILHTPPNGSAPDQSPGKTKICWMNFMTPRADWMIG